MSQKVLVTGGTGFIGRNVVIGLIKQGCEVRVFDNNSRGNVESMGEYLNHFEFVEGDIRDEKAVEKVCKDMDVVVHLAYINGTEYFYKKPYQILDVGIRGMLNVLEAHKKHQFSKMLLASTSEVYQSPQDVPTPEVVPLVVPDPLNPRYSYGGGKIASELLLTNYAFENSLDYKIFRPHNIYGPNMGNEHVIPQLIKKIRDAKLQSHDSVARISIQGEGDQTRAFCHIKDFVQGFLKILEDKTESRIYNIGRNDEVSIKELVKTLARLMNENIEIRHEQLPLGSTLRRCPDISLLERIGYRSRVSLEEGLVETINWYDSNS
jgi:nucleoside-diphosphate-sugar epimerase